MTREEILKKLRAEWELCLDDWDLPLTEDKEFILTLLDEHQGSGDDPSALRNASESLKNDKNFIILAAFFATFSMFSELVATFGTFSCFYDF